MISSKGERGFTLIEVLVVIIIIAILGAIAIPKLSASIANSREKADVATGRQVKGALDRYQVENGAYPVLSSSEGTVTGEGFIPDYISVLSKETTQQVSEDKEGFGVEALVEGSEPSGEASNLIMIYLSDDHKKAEVQVYDTEDNVLWTSAD